MYFPQLMTKFILSVVTGATDGIGKAYAQEVWLQCFSVYMKNQTSLGRSDK